MGQLTLALNNKFLYVSDNLLKTTLDFVFFLTVDDTFIELNRSLIRYLLRLIVDTYGRVLRYMHNNHRERWLYSILIKLKTIVKNGFDG